MENNKIEDARIIINAAQVKINVAEVLRIDPDILAQEYAQQAAVYGWVGSLLADAEHRRDTAKARKEEVVADLDGFYRDKLAGSKYTEAVITANIKLDGDYGAADESVINADHEYRQLRHLHDALKMRSDMLISLGAHLRMESEMTGMSVLDKNVKKLKGQV